MLDINLMGSPRGATMPAEGPAPAAIVLGGGANALSVVRSLGRRRVRVYALCERESPVRYSRHARWVPIEKGPGMQVAYRRWLTGPGAGRAPGAAILPCDDDGLELVARHRAELSRVYRVSYAADDVLLAMLDKERTYALARSIGVPAPATLIVRDEADLARVPQEIGFPCALKPRHSHRFAQHFPNRKLFVAEDHEALRLAFERVRPLGLEMIATEIIPGGDERYCSYFTYIDEDGRPLFHFTKRKPRQYPIHFGLGTYHVTDWSPEVAELGLRFFEGVGLRGLGNVEFKRDARDGKLKLIECNARFVASNELVRASGLDLALLVYNTLVGRPPPPLGRYRRGVSAIRPFADLLAFRDAHRRGELSLGSWLRSVLRPHSPLHFSWRDPMPSLAMAGWFLRKRLDRELARMRGATRPAVAAEAATARVLETVPP